MNIEAFKGYILEDAISKLLSVNGYTLVKKNDSDTQEIHNGLNVIGRGAFHQADSLGQFQWTPPFLYPIRLFVEAKFRNKPAGIDLVREAVGIINDLNQNFSTIRLDNQEVNLPRYDYRYVIFSTGGFTNPAITMALAHKIHMIDLSGYNYQSLLNTIHSFAEEVFRLYRNNIKDNSISTSTSRRIRLLFRELIYLTPEQFNKHHLNEKNQDLINLGNQVEKIISSIGGIYFATTNTPSILALVPDDNYNFKLSLRKNPTQDVAITWTSQSQEWIIKGDNFNLRFTLPESIEKYIFEGDPLTAKINALNTKNIMLNKLNFLAVWDSDRPQLCTLKFNYKDTQREIARRNASQ
ncbi:hypothetical protein AB6878_09035 [Carnobacterium maltaromaticum]|uniref:hypothetical protein n=1 Tax=Carnobacterium maltaromaticum TaxID=2751 RepID=UPI0039BE1721